MDANLVVRAQAGDEGAFTTLAGESWDRLYQLALRILRDESLAEDAAQQAVVSMWRKLPQLRDPVRFEAWTYRLLVNACASQARRTRRRLPEITGLTVPHPVAPDGYGAIVDRDQLDRAFRRLSVDQRAVLVLHHYLDMPVDAIAEVLALAPGTVKSRLHRGLVQVRRAMVADMPRPQPAPQEVAR
jgi:RNA polymerase sigma-70 factor (ECF subfamily)